MTKIDPEILPRPSIARFAKQCELVLRDNDHKVGWHSMSYSDLLSRLADELAELIEAIRTADLPAIKKESCDIGNFAMMVHDITEVVIDTMEASDGN